MNMRMQVGIILSVLIFGCFGGAQQESGRAKPASRGGTSSGGNLPSEEEVNAFLHATFGYDPQLTWKISSIKPSEVSGLAEVSVQMSGPQGQGTQNFFVSQDGKHAVVGEIIPFGSHPFEKARQELEKRASGPSRGPATAPVLIVEFSDLQCPHCKEANPTIERLLKEDPNVRFVFQNFPLPSHNWAQKAASYADCVGKLSGDAFWTFIDSVYAGQNEITADNADGKLTQLADQAGVKGSEAAACASRSETQARVQASANLGKSLGVNSTPTLFINGRPVGVSDNNYEVLKKLVDFSAKER